MKTNRFFLAIAMIACMMPGRAQEIEAEEPVIITAPDTTIDKTAYSLSAEGISIAVSYGSAYPATHTYNNIGVTYFAVLAGGSMTISAEDSIRGIAINGWTKQNFSASCDYGTIDYISDEYDDAIGEPVLTISDINSPSLTIACDKQLRCFSIEVYFSQNPDAPQTEAMDTVRLTMVTAEAQDYSEDTTYSSEGAYSYWLKLAPETGYPEIWLDLYAASKGNLSGKYSPYDFNVGDYSYVQLSADEMDYEYAYDQEFTIGISTDGGTSYLITGWLLAENDVLYMFDYSGPMAIVPSYDEQGINNIQRDDVQCTKALRNGQLLILRGDKTYTLQGQEVK